ncbi:cell division protein FtsZ [Hydrogenophaga crassostreae]|uniref:Cell division protein ZipA n=1 Tax=Hydrogenophaga crassostreae TaxID=1763535 RepID=A0A163CFL6_9BURK|nr:cell division protein ZipA C-terminal FtsZ-binding domain-containing protein [Hydrogenophaga crassostreae]AOW13574.1 cell division protein FtsZ [Hydrogenophaga crassostreae]OAD41868.1 cell division protein FtsZ [Hydrogenophaga crassostreae]
MSTLQLSLAIIGGLVLAGVIAYNTWVTRQNEPRTARDPAVSSAADGQPGGFDPLGDEAVDTRPPERIEPVLGEPLGEGSGAAVADTPISHDEGDAGSQGSQPVPDGTSTPQPAPPVATMREPVSPLKTALSASADRKPKLDALIDVITPIEPEGAVSGDAVVAALPTTRRVGSKPFAVEGLSDLNGEWEVPRLGQRYHLLQAGVQLANRAGALNDIEFSEFVAKAQTFADAIGAATDFPDMRAEVARARELDAFASGHDAQLGFTLRARRSAWSPGFVAQHAARIGFVPGALPGRMVLPGSERGQAPILSLSFDAHAAMAEDPEKSALREVALSLEVTHVPRSEQPFVRMREAATALAESMEGVITDDAGQPLSTDTMDVIGSDLENLYDALDSHDLSAGSPQARRLFS